MPLRFWIVPRAVTRKALVLLSGRAPSFYRKDAITLVLD